MDQNHLFLGIDTGGTYTDGVLLDPQTYQVVKTVKTLTTHADLRECIAAVLDDLVPGAPAPLGLVSLSTTLATNAILEDRRKPAGLLLLGYDRELVEHFQFQRQFGSEHVRYIPGRHELSGEEQVPLDEQALAQAAAELAQRVDAFAIASYAGPANPAHEELAGEIVTRLCNLPVVLAHTLSSELNSIHRATTASLNASILGNAQEFLQAVLEMLAARGVCCPVMILRSDGSLVKASFASQRPVEIIHSGPATSAIGGQFLSGAQQAVVVDMGGTSTDIALVENGQIPIDPHPARIGKFHTCVRSVQTRSIGLGGDSRISFDHYQRLSIGPERLTPISRLAFDQPHIKTDLGHYLGDKKALLYSDRAEYWRLLRLPRHPLESDKERQIVAILQTEGPQRFSSLIQQVGSISPFIVKELVSQEIVERAGLTPTDLLHLSGEFAPWDAEAAWMLAEAAARHWHETPLAFAQRIHTQMTRTIAAEILQFISQHNLSAPSLQPGGRGLDRWLFEQSLHPDNAYLGSRIFLKVPLVAIGAPAQAFLGAVADALGTEVIFPQHHAVANAVGTVVGNVMVRKEGEVNPYVEGAAVTGYTARAGSRQARLGSFEQAVDFARQALLEQVSEEAQAAGASEFALDCTVNIIWEGMARLSAWAIGKPAQG